MIHNFVKVVIKINVALFIDHSVYKGLFFFSVYPNMCGF